MYLSSLVLIISICFGFESHAQDGNPYTATAYIEKYKDLAIKEMQRSGVPASITLAQGMLESGNGGSRLAVKANNHFGIKCHDWKGKKIHHDDDKRRECFRKYNSVYDSYMDHSDFLMNSGRYSMLFELSPTDYKGWAKGLKKAGYATSRTYDDALINLIEKHKLYEYDVPGAKGTGQIKDKVPPDIESFSFSVERKVLSNNRVHYILAEKGDTYESLTNELDFMDWQLAKYNDIEKDKTFKEGEVVYLQPKRFRADRDNKVHMVQKGETMRDISQKYAVKLKSLYRFNRIKKGEEPAVGQEINLRKRKKEIPLLQEENDNTEELQFEFDPD